MKIYDLKISAKLSTYLVGDKITESKAGYSAILKVIEHMDSYPYNEVAGALLLSRNNHVIGHLQIGSGNVSGSFVDYRKLILALLQRNASGVIIFHNHPSGKMKPSNDDYRITDILKKILTGLNSQLVDHIIIGDDEYYSFSDNGNI